MKVYRIEADGSYGGGMAIVAANTQQEALEIAATIRDKLWCTDYAKGRITDLPLSFDGPPSVITHYETGE